jgi:phosphate transport system substrate-binding protein
MKFQFRIPLFIACAITVAYFVGCKKTEQIHHPKETIITGSTSILVDETLVPIIEDQIAVFESEYNATIYIEATAEAELSKKLISDTTRLAILSRKLNDMEMAYFKSKNIIPKITHIGSDAIVLIRNKADNDTLINLSEIKLFIEGNTKTSIKGLVFDNLNSSTYRFLKDTLAISKPNTEMLFSYKTNEEVINYIAHNKGMIGVVGINWLYQPTHSISDNIDKISVLSVKGLTADAYYAPSQNNLAEGTYPLARDLFIINCQGYSGLGMGFASFVAGDIGQRIVLKSGLLPVRIPHRKLDIKTK